MSEPSEGIDCDFGDRCIGDLEEAHSALADIARSVEAAGGNCDGDEGIPDVTRGVSNYIDNAKEELAALIAENEAAVKNMAALQSELASFKNWQPSDPGTKEAMAEIERRLKGVLVPDGLTAVSQYGSKAIVGDVRYMIDALRAAMVRLEEAEAKLPAMKALLKKCAIGIGAAIMEEDGLDGSDGEVLLRMIEAALEESKI